MTEINHQDLKDVLFVVGRALECSEIDDMRREVLSCLEKILHCDQSTFFLGSRKTYKDLDYAGGVTRGIDPEFLHQYICHYYRLDPYPPELMISPSVVTTEQIISYADLVKGEYYNDFFQPQSIHYQMSIVLRSSNRVLGALSFFRPRYKVDFSSRDKSKVQLMVPYLEEILQKNILLSQIKYQAEVLETISLNLNHKGIVLLDESFVPIYVDEKAKKILSSLRPGDDDQGAYGLYLPQEISRQCETLKALACDSEEPNYHPLRLELEQAGEQLSVLVRLIKRKNRPLHFLIYLEARDREEPLAQILCNFGLTRREQEVAHLVCMGLKNNEISDRLFISAHTVENHLRSIYWKLGVCNRTSLVHRVMSLS
jgi:DNA-binding CsgD family transcriptional regulator